MEIAKDVLDKKIKNDTALHLFKGVDYSNKRMRDDAITEFKKAIAFDPNYSAGYSNIGVIYLDKGMTEEAMNWFKKAVEIDSNDAISHNNIGPKFCK